MQQGTAPHADDEGEESGTIAVAAYMRVSTAEQRHRYGIPAQRQAIQAYAERCPAWRLVEYRQDSGASGSTDSRPGFDALLGDIAAGRVRLVAVHRLDRLGRTEAAIWRCIWQIEDAGAQVECCAEPLVDPGIDRWLTIDRMAQEVEADYRRIVARTQAGRQLKAVGGGWPGGPAPYGYRLKGKGSFGSVLEVDPEEAGVVALIADLLTDGRRSLKDVAADLNDRGIRTRNGRQWTPSNLSRRLDSGTFFGEAVFRRTDRQWGGHCTSIDGDGQPVHGESVPLALPPILTTDQVRAVGEAWAAMSRPRRNPIAEYPLTGRIRGRCGLPYVGGLRGKDGLRTYRCSGMRGTASCGCVFLPAAYAEEQMAERVNGMLASMPAGSRPSVPTSAAAPLRLSGHTARVALLDQLAAERRQDLQEARGMTAPDHLVAAAVRQIESDLGALGRIAAHARDWLHELEASVLRDAPLRAVLASPTPDVLALPPREQRRLVELLDVRVEVADPTFRYREGTKCLTMQWHQRTGELIPPDPTDGQWERVDRLLRSRFPAHHFRSPVDLRAALTGMLHRLRSGILWSELPTRFGDCAKVRVRQRVWGESGVWEAIVRLLNEEGRGTPVFQRTVPSLRIRTVLDADQVA
ncbi:recombinase family protein [Streptomyces sp. NPDC088358]|uniref:recombinase family protein n=1 Tax=Streptomyces sp. NPDC088358 TaxID=3365857 RepID=UPI0037FDA1FB